MKIKILVILFITIVVSSCKKDGGGTDDFVPIPVRDRAEQQIIDNDSLLGYFETHYYNSTELAGMTNPGMSDIVITLLPEGDPVPVGHTLLMDDVVTRTTVFQEADYEYYILSINEGGGSVSPHFCDNVRVNYFGTLLDDDPIPFDSTVNPITTDLLNLVRGWQIILPEFNIAANSTVSGDGTVLYEDYGLGVMFLPSGLGFYANSAGDIPLYSPLIFKFELLETAVLDHDNDNVPSFLEDIDGDLLLSDDTDEDTFPNFVDGDDDDDGTRTIDEDLEDTDLLVDSDGDGDPTNDKNGDGDPTNDDTDGDGIPNYLDTDDSEAKLDDN